MNDWLKVSPRFSLSEVCAQLAPALDIDLYVRTEEAGRHQAVAANDWLTLSHLQLLRRVAPKRFEGAENVKFGLWSHLSDLRDQTGQVAGRCAVQPETILGIALGVGVVKGLLAGIVDGIAGIIFTRPQSDLARKDAIPDVGLSEVQRWANEQKTLLNTRLEEKRSALLANFGASHTGLNVGKFGGESVSYEGFVRCIQGASEVLIHRGEIDYHEDDEVSPKNFQRCFEPTELLLELATRRAPSWLDQIPDESISRDSWSMEAVLDAALMEAWGGVEWDDGEVVVGSVDGCDIERKCRIASRGESGD